jgi:PPOX class probable F420-dependent enzyme
MIDLSTEFGKRVARRLSEEEIIWLTTTDSQGSPQPRPVWFLWDDNSILIYSKPHVHKVTHISHQPRVSLNLNSNESGGNIVVILGEAQIVEEPIPEQEVESYLEKYQHGLKQINMTEDEFRKSYSLAIKITPRKLRGH